MDNANKSRLHWLSHDDIGAIIIQLSYTVRIPIFRLIDLYHVKLGCDLLYTAVAFLMSLRVGRYTLSTFSSRYLGFRRSVGDIFLVPTLSKF